MRSRAAGRGLRLPADGDELRLRPLARAARRARSSSRGLVVRIFADGIRITLRRPRENDVAARGARRGDRRRRRPRSAYVARTSTETALRLSLDLDGQGRARVATGHRLPRPPAHALRLPRRLRSRAARRRRPRRRRAPHWSRTSSRRSATRSRRRSARAAASRATARRRCRWTRRARPRRSTSCDGRTRRSTLALRAATGSAGSRSRCCRTRSSGSPCRAASRCTSSASGRGRPPRRRGGVQGARPRARRGVRDR